MSILDRKMCRDLLHLKAQALAICLVMASGVATFVMSLSTLSSLDHSQQIYYERTQFAHVFAHLKRAPDSLADRIAAVPGVTQVQTRVVVEVNLDLPTMREPAVGRLISLPEQGAPLLNALHLRQGRYPEPDRRGEVLASEVFVEAHRLRPGDKIRAVINGRRQDLEIVGVVLSPEYILQIQGGSLLPDEKRFGVFWMGHQELASAFNLEGAFNDVALTLQQGASEPEVLRQLDQLTAAYGGVGAYGRSEQLSHRYLTEEIRQLRSMALMVPTIFLSVAAFLFNVVLSRLISTQREEIAALKAFGYRSREVGRHYLKLVLVIAGAGTLLGGAVGLWMGRGLTDLYIRFYRIPESEFQVEAATLLGACLTSGSAAVLGAMAAVRRAVRLPPAEALRPEPPASYRPTILERSGLQGLVPTAGKMILRQLERHPFKALLSCLGIAMAAAVLVLGGFGKDAVEYMMEFQFALGQRQDAIVNLVEPASPDARHDFQKLPGVHACETFRAVPTRIRSGHRSWRVGIMGLMPGAELFRLLDEKEREIPLPSAGLLISSKLSEVLAIGAGDLVTVEVLEGQRPVREVVVAGVITDFGGPAAYMEDRALHRLLGEDAVVSGAFLSVDSQKADLLYATLKSTPRVASVNLTEAALQSFRETMAENMLRMQGINAIFACIIAFGVVYNSVRISFSERSRELATLRVIGLTRAEVSAILLGELAILTLVAIPLGFLMGYGFVALAVSGMQTELYTIPLVVRPATYGFAAVVVLAAAMASGLVVRRRIDHLDLVAVLKTRE